MLHPILLFYAFDYCEDHKQDNWHNRLVNKPNKNLYSVRYDMGTN